MKKRSSGTRVASQRSRDWLIQQLYEEGIINSEVLKVMGRTPRDIFVDEALSSRAYENTALPIGFGQTLSQPYIVARMTESLLVGGPLQKVLEVGTGSGYQTTVLARLAGLVYTIERIKPLLIQAQMRFSQLGITNIRAKYADGFEGWPACGPYQGILVTAAPTEIPQQLLKQLAVGGRMVIPVGTTKVQSLITVTKTVDGFEMKTLERVSFVPLVGDKI
ncbi:protein-L-isoaspartate O-methyltransferase [Candidatus Nitrosoglobus terrae]|uniref:Protein-L-isoaspartate O-methyltransferase n=1 Tax=Candidatus Nitrosoglobus terrae TaxID=1630141 RepID=A0A1Q2SLT9_9GAMM|nr:protein-L-isoaspartate(D-aspartate) O-methyltransferase [Candidatus Nitrosoglobus terrae]BAW80067.1 protein-L-isoaspartate O-methyltransferase [Candidatus Nitrosoglobus terrae]